MAINLNSISSDPVIAPPRLIVHGPHGLGKTTFAAHAPGVILLPLEDGLGTLAVPHFPQLKSYTEVSEAMLALASEAHEYATVAVDSLDWLEPLVWTETCRRNGWSSIEQPGYGKGYMAAADVWREFFDGLMYLRMQRRMQVVLLAHSEIKRFDAPDTEPYDRYQLKLQPRAGALAEEWADAVLFMNWKIYTTKDDVGFNKKQTRGLGVGERVLYTEERPAHRAKNRYSLPPEIRLPNDPRQSYAAFAAAMFPAAAPVAHSVPQPAT